MRKNILILGHGYGPQFIDINNQYTHLFDQNKCKVTVVYLIGEPDEHVTQKHTADEVIYLNLSKRTMRGLKLLVIKRLIAFCRQQKFEMVICHRYKPIYLMLWVAQFYSFRALFFVLHDIGTLHHLQRKLLIAALVRKNMFFAGVSNAVRDDLRKDIWRVPLTRVITLYNMIDVEFTEAQFISRLSARQQFGVASDDFLFGIVARLVKIKDHHNLINAFSLIKPHCPRARLLIMGSGDLEATLKKQVSDLHLENEVIFTGFVDQSFRYMKMFDVFILNSIREAFGRVLLEAMIAKVPIIATNTHGIPEVTDDTGVLIEPTNPTQLAEKMLELYNTSNTNLEHIGNRGYQRACREFSFERFKEIFWQSFRVAQ